MYNYILIHFGTALSEKVPNSPSIFAVARHQNAFYDSFTLVNVCDQWLKRSIDSLELAHKHAHIQFIGQWKGIVKSHTR